MAETSIGPICQLEDFVRLCKENRQEAMELFFLPGFPSIFLKHLPEQDAMYHSLMKSRSRNMIVEEFLSAGTYHIYIFADGNMIGQGDFSMK